MTTADRPARTSLFLRFPSIVARNSGHPAAFWVALVNIAVWATTGPAFGFSAT